jgi:phosphatidylethanolamine/phosphatidyl-N-methylethanolamine N-methyltransferase
LSLRFSYTLIAPLYDAVVARASERARAQSLSALRAGEGELVLMNGIGTGLDLPHLPHGPRYLGLDLTQAMLKRAKSRAGGLDIILVQGDALELPFRDNCFDYAVLHLILAVVPQPVRCLRETARVLKPGGQILILDKFLRAGERAWLRRALNPLSSRLATRLDVVFEQVLAEVPALKLAADEPVLLGGWFRRVRLVK